LLRAKRPFGFHSHKTGLEKLTCFTMNYLNKPITHFGSLFKWAYALIGLTLFCWDSYHRKFTMCMSIGLVNNHSKLYTAVVCPKSGFEAQVEQQ
jgi:hypothetical protein